MTDQNVTTNENQSERKAVEQDKPNARETVAQEAKESSEEENVVISFQDRVDARVKELLDATEKHLGQPVAPFSVRNLLEGAVASAMSSFPDLAGAVDRVVEQVGKKLEYHLGAATLDKNDVDHYVHRLTGGV